jgi:predicted RND superfamily exporter protein
MEEHGLLSSVESLWSYLPPADVQRERIEKLRGAGVEWERVREDFLASIREAGFREAAFAPALESLRVAISRKEPLSHSDILELAETPFVQAFLHEREGVHTTALYLYPRRENFTPQDIDAIRASLRDLGHDRARVRVDLVGASILGQELKQRTRTGFFAVTAMALILTLGVLSIHFRKPLRVLLALTPLICCVVWLLGLMAVFRVQVNVMNVAVTPMLLGIGIDDAVFVLNAYLHEARRDILGTFHITGRAVALTTVTTCIGFGSLAFADHPGLASMGTLAIFGVCLALLATCTLLPASVQVFKRWVQ